MAKIFAAVGEAGLDDVCIEIYSADLSQAVLTATTVLEAYNSANYADYQYPAAEELAGSDAGVYSIDVPDDLPNGSYKYRATKGGDYADGSEYTGVGEFTVPETSDAATPGEIQEMIDDAVSEITVHGDANWTDAGFGGGDGSVLITQDYGGDGNLVYEVDDVPIDGATIRAYLREDFDEGRLDVSFVKGTTFTNNDGTWTRPLALDPGDYVFYAFKQNEYGPDAKEVTVT